ncbi:MAG: M15 family metallopeptidase [Pikeienuella sp.]
MTRFSDRSQQRFGGVDPRLIEILNIVRQRTGIPFEVSEGRRDLERQKKLVAEGKSQTLNSRHLTGNAVDIHIPDGQGGVNWDFEAYRPLGDMAKQVAAELGYNDFVWGGDWKSLKDGVHYQIGGSHKGHNHGNTGSPQGSTLPAYQPQNTLAQGTSFNPEAQNALAQPQLRLQSNLLDPRAFALPTQPVNRLAYT